MNKVFNKIALAFTGFAMAIGVGVGIYNNRDRGVEPVEAAESTVATLNSSAVSWGTGYGSKQDSSGYKWSSNIGLKNTSDQTVANRGVWLGANEKNKDNMYLGYGSYSEASAIATALSIQDTAKYYAAAFQSSGGTAISNINKITVTFNSNGNGQANGCWAVYSTNSGTTWNIFGSKATTGLSSVTFTQSTSVSGLFGIVYSFPSYGVVKNVVATFINRTLTTQTITGDTSGTVGTGVSLSTNATSSTSWTITANTCGATLSAATGKSISVSATSAGSVSLKAVCDGYTDATHTITFASAAAESITVTGTSSMYVGDASISLTATPSNFTPSSYTWNSTNTSVATVSGTGSTGTVSAVAKGTTQITASATGTSGTVVSNSFTLTVKQFSISLSSTSVTMKASRSTTVTVTPTDANGTVVVTATSNNTSVATTSVSGTTITINSGNEGNTSTTITVAAKDNNGASGYHTAESKTINLTISAGYTIGNKITSLPTSDKKVFLIADYNSTPKYISKTLCKTYESTNVRIDNTNGYTTDDSDAAIFTLSSTGTLRFYNDDNDTNGGYLYNSNAASNGNTQVAISSNASTWSNGMNNEDYPGLLQLSHGRFLSMQTSDYSPKAPASSNLSSSSYTKIYAYEAIATVATVTLNENSISGMKGNSDTTSLTLTISNFTATGLNVTYKDSGESSFSESSDIVSVSCGHSAGSNAVSVSFVGVGSTTVKLSVTRSTGDPIEKTFTATVSAKPNLLKVVQNRAANPLIDITSVELQNSVGSRQFTKTNIYVEDTDGNAIEIGTISEYVTISKLSGDDCVSINGGEITATAVGSAVIKFTLKSLTSVYDTVTVNVINDYKTTVNTLNVVNGVDVVQGEVLVVDDHISEKVANTHFGSTTTISDNELLFSYTNNRSAGVIYSSFVWDVTDQTLDTGDTEERTVYVFVTFNESYAGTSFTAIVEVADKPVEGLLFNGVAKSDDDEIPLSLPRNSTYNFNEHVTVNPANASESHEIVYTLEEGEDYVSLSNGILTIGQNPGNTVACVSAYPAAKTDFVIYFWISITRETITVDADVPIIYSKVTDASSLEEGDVIVVASEAQGKIMGTFDGSNKYADEVAATFDDGVTSGASGMLELTLEESETEGKWYLKSGTKYLYGTTSKTTLCLSDTACDITITISDGNATIDFGSGCRILHNVGSNRFSNYSSSTSVSMLLPQIYLKSGGPQTVTINDDCFDAINDAMQLKSGSTTLYDLGLCDATGNTFNTTKWNQLAGTFTSAIITANQLAYATANANGNEVEQFLAVYDYIVAKYPSATDFLGRVTSGKIVRMKPFSVLSDLSENGGSFLIIALTTIISVTALGGYFFLRKKKEN